LWFEAFIALQASVANDGHADLGINCKQLCTQLRYILRLWSCRNYDMGYRLFLCLPDDICYSLGIITAFAVKFL
jgi:hypothetical protein